MSAYLAERRIPATMATQHPDNASPPFWRSSGEGFISAYEEVEECYLTFARLGCEEYMWDWEGKHVDEAVVDRLLADHLDFFQSHPLGEDVFLTFRLPNVWVERGYRLARAFTNILTARDLAKDLQLFTPPLFEVILPMCDEAWKMFYLQENFDRAAQLQQQMFGSDDPFHRLHVIPLIETPELLINAKQLLDDYLKLHREHYGDEIPYMRTFIARSDPALNSGMVPSVLAAKGALCEFAAFEAETGIPLYPIIGAGSLPFRGGLTPATVGSFLEEYRGLRTVTLQSAFRYDYSLDAVERAVRDLKLALSLQWREKPTWEDGVKQKLTRLIQIFTGPYQETVEGLAELINQLATHIPRRRERMLHIGLFGYPRGVGGKVLPRAIVFTAAFYSLGVPPEFLGTGRALRQAESEGLLDVLLRYYHNLRSDLERAGAFLCWENLDVLARESSVWRAVREDVELCQSILGIELGPREPEDYLHRNLASSIFRLWRSGRDEGRLRRYIEEAAAVRRSLG